MLLPVRDEAAPGRAVPAAAAGADRRARPRVLVLDDGSTDGTADVVRRVAAARSRARRRGVRRVRLLTVRRCPTAGWGKPWACHQLADGSARRAVLVFLDADVVLAPHAVAASVALLRWSRAGPRVAVPAPGRGTPRRAARAAAAAVVVAHDAAAAGRRALGRDVAGRRQRPAARRRRRRPTAGPAATRRSAREMLEDVALLRAVKRTGGRGIGRRRHAARDLPDVRRLAGAARRLREVAVVGVRLAGRAPRRSTAVLGLAYVVPPLAALRGSRAGAVGLRRRGRRAGARRPAYRGRVWPTPSRTRSRSRCSPGSRPGRGGCAVAARWPGRAARCDPAAAPRPP